MNKGDLQHQYQAERAEILKNPGLSWEKKMLAIKQLFEKYRRREEEAA